MTIKGLTDYVAFRDTKLASRYQNKKIPISTLFEAYFDGAVDFKGDIYEMLANRHNFTTHEFTPEHVKYFVTKFLPETLIHSQKDDTKLVRGHYDRGDDFFEAFLGPRMVYTSGFFKDPGQTLEQAQDQKLDLVCQKLGLKPGETLLDIGCGWGTLAIHAAKYYGVQATGVTLSENQAAFANRRIKEAGLEGKAQVLCLDYRAIPDTAYDKVVSLEMVEHVGVKNLDTFYSKVRGLLKDEGLFLLQWTGLRRAAHMEDLVWGLFMAKYIFPGADASLPVAGMLAACEKANWEVHSVENISIHYCYTIKKWHDNWLRNEAAMRAAYGERWFRIWNFFLAWAVVAGTQGTAACCQVVMNKNLNEYNRARWVGHAGLSERMEVPGINAPARKNGIPAAAARR
jgi:cyclopropane fatty-acyl-phospholipid synthase-like methyltransferase